MTNRCMTFFLFSVVLAMLSAASNAWPGIRTIQTSTQTLSDAITPVKIGEWKTTVRRSWPLSVTPKQWHYRWEITREPGMLVETYIIDTPYGTCQEMEQPFPRLDPPSGALKTPDAVPCIVVGDAGLGKIAVVANLWDPYTGLVAIEAVSHCPPAMVPYSVTAREGPKVHSANGIIPAPWCADPVGVDTDGDGREDALDNCTLAPNGPTIPDPGGYVQRDWTGDGYGTICDPDFNADGTVNFEDLGLLNWKFGQDDRDKDLDGSGVVDINDRNIMYDYFYGPPGPSGYHP